MNYLETMTQLINEIQKIQSPSFQPNGFQQQVKDIEHPTDEQWLNITKKYGISPEKLNDVINKKHDIQSAVKTFNELNIKFNNTQMHQ